MSKHKYEIEAGEVLSHEADGIRFAVGLTFYIWDTKTKMAVFCEYISHMSEKDRVRQYDAIAHGTLEVRQRGLGASRDGSKWHKLLVLEKPIDMKLLDSGTPGALSFGDPRDGSSALTTATVTLDEGHVQLPFLIVSDVQSVGRDNLNTRGYIAGEKPRKVKHRPKISTDEHSKNKVKIEY